MVHQDWMDHLELQDPKELLDTKDLLVLLVCQAKEAFLAQKDLKEAEETLDSLDQKER